MRHPTPTHRTGSRFESIDSHETLLSVLGRELSHCECGSDETLPLLRDFLGLVRDRTRAGDPERSRSANAALEKCVNALGSPAVASWLVYLLEAKGVLVHGFSLFDLELTYDGQVLAEKLELYVPRSADRREAQEPLRDHR